MKFVRTVAVVILSAAAAAAPQIVTAQGDTLVGKWIFVPERSKFSGPAPYKSLTLTFAQSGKTLTKTVEGVDASGKDIKATYDVTIDGKAHPVTGKAEYDTSTWRRVSDTGTVYTYDKRKSTVGVGTRTIANEGKTITFRESPVDAKGKQLSPSVIFFVKEGVDLASLIPPKGAAPAAPPPVVATVPPPPTGPTPDEEAGLAALERGDNDEAIRLFTKVIEEKQQTVALYYNYLSRGVAYAKKGQSAEAMKDFDETLNLKAGDTDALFRRAGLHLQEKQYQAAIDDFTKMLEADMAGTDPNRATAFRLRGFAFNTLGDDGKAASDYTDACNLNKEYCQ